MGTEAVNLKGQPGQGAEPVDAFPGDPDDHETDRYRGSRRARTTRLGAREGWLLVASLLGAALVLLIGFGPRTAVPWQQKGAPAWPGVDQPAELTMSPGGVRPGTPTPAASTSGTSATPTPTPSPSGTPSPTPATTIRPTTTGSPVVTRPAPTSTRSAQSFTPMVIQAEDPRNDLRGGAQVVACGRCDAGARVRYIGGPNQLVVRATMPVAGVRTVTVRYESDGRRSLLISVNNAAPMLRWVSGGGDWETPANFSFSTYLPAGPVEMTFYQETDPAPDVDSVAIS